jgi:hypothetical protein
LGLFEFRGGVGNAPLDTSARIGSNGGGDDLESATPRPAENRPKPTSVKMVIIIRRDAHQNFVKMKVNKLQEHHFKVHIEAFLLTSQSVFANNHPSLNDNHGAHSQTTDTHPEGR